MPRFLLTVAVLASLLGFARPARAASCPEADHPRSLAERIDGVFGDWFVAPVGAVLFFDLAFWDNRVPYGQMPPATDTSKWTEARREAKRKEALRTGLELHGPTLDGFVQGEGYRYACRVPATLASLRPRLEAPITRTLGTLQVELTEQDGRLIGTAAPQSVPLAKLGIAPLSGAEGASEADAGEPTEAIVTLEPGQIAPFAVQVDRRTGTSLPVRVELPWSTVEIAAGSEVFLPDGTPGRVVLTSGSRASVELPTEVFEDASLANPHDTQAPLVVVWLVLGAVFFTLRMMFVNVRAFFHAIAVTAGRYDDDDDPGEVTHFQALSSALSATVGLGNIAGVAIAVGVGGPGAIVWMVIAALLGMSSKFVECTLGQMFRVVHPDGTVSGGPMYYLSTGLKQLGLGPFGTVLGVVFAVMCIGGSFGGGNMFQGNQSYQALADVLPIAAPRATGDVVFVRGPARGEIDIPEGTEVYVPHGPSFVTTAAVQLAASQAESAPVPVAAKTGGLSGNLEPLALTHVKDPEAIGGIDTVRNNGATVGGADRGWVYGLLLAFLVGLVIVGGIKRIGQTASVIVPAMCLIYVLAGVYILVYNAPAVPGAVGTILSSAFTPEAGLGALVWTVIQGFRRASFSNEAGIGSASIAHSAAATDEPVREGIVALLEPFIDTVVVCTMTGLVVVVTGVYQHEGLSGITMTSEAFAQGGLPWFPYLLTVAVVLFAYSTMISWSYYGERASTWMFGERAKWPYKIAFLIAAFFGPVFGLTNVLDFSDLMVLGMAFPNVLGCVLLAPKVKRALDDYLGRLRSGAMQPNRPGR